MKSAVVLVRQMVDGHQQTWGGAFAEGLHRHGWAARLSTAPEPCDMLVVWGVRRQDVIQRQKARGEVCVLERGYLADRMRWTSVSFGGGLNGRGVFRGPFDDPSRWRQHFADLMQPWRRNPGGYALILGQVPGDMSVQNVSLEAFYSEAHAALKALGFDVRFRRHPHPAAARSGTGGAPELRGELDEALAGAAFTVAWNSNAGVLSALAGVPTVAMDRGSMAWEVAGHTLSLPPMPPREAWAHALAWKQWTKEEMASGECWGFISDNLPDRPASASVEALPAKSSSCVVSDSRPGGC